jgi:hypothetical protein
MWRTRNKMRLGDNFTHEPRKRTTEGDADRLLLRYKHILAHNLNDAYTKDMLILSDYVSI